MSTKDLGITTDNVLLPFIPGKSWPIVSGDVGDLSMPTFNWIQAFWESSFTDPAILAVWSGDYNDAGVMIVNPIRFAYSGERVVFKGKVILANGVDRFGNTVTSSAIGTDLSAVYGFGGV